MESDLGEFGTKSSVALQIEAADNSAEVTKHLTD